jgi:hypothetical protein
VNRPENNGNCVISIVTPQTGEETDQSAPKKALGISAGTMPIRLAGKGYLVIGLVTQPPLGQRPEEVVAFGEASHTLTG